MRSSVHEGHKLGFLYSSFQNFFFRSTARSSHILKSRFAFFLLKGYPIPASARSLTSAEGTGFRPQMMRAEARKCGQTNPFTHFARSRNDIVCKQALPRRALTGNKRIPPVWAARGGKFRAKSSDGTTRLDLATVGVKAHPSYDFARYPPRSYLGTLSTWLGVCGASVCHSVPLLAYLGTRIKLSDSGPRW